MRTRHAREIRRALRAVKKLGRGATPYRYGIGRRYGVGGQGMWGSVESELYTRVYDRMESRLPLPLPPKGPGGASRPRRPDVEIVFRYQTDG